KGDNDIANRSLHGSDRPANDDGVAIVSSFHGCRRHCRWAVTCANRSAIPPAAPAPQAATPPLRQGVDELAAPHSKISSALPDKGSGTVMPSALAVFRLRKSSTLVDC